jgi:nanoRNase/pAp phosphatase (c-di-AMP/oligoRNAs hydrolase)
MLKIFDYIKRFDKITLFFHSHPDMDALGSCFAMQNFIEHNFKNKKVIIARSPTLKIEETKNIFPKQKNKPNNFLSQSLGIILDTANMERIAASEYKHCKTLIRIDHHPKVETIGEYE